MDAVPFVCKCCGLEEFPKNSMVRARLEERGLCQGCRAAETLAARPWLLSEFVSFWKASGFPASGSWLRTLPAIGEFDAAAPSPAAGQLWDHRDDAS